MGDAQDLYMNTLGCDSLAYGIFERGTDALTESSVDCATSVGDAYDPTNSCVDFSGSEFCTNGVLCDGNSDSAYVYNCDFAADRYSCAPGDLSDKVMAIYCPYADSATPVYLACAPIEAVGSGDDNGGVDGLSFVMACFVSLIALLLH